CTLSADQRVLDGARGAELLQAVQSYIEQPGLMLL
ncbi:MAG: 2-oxo acid dehydrogenase subunit E2, partial [Acidobacteriota bacterium]|nr:2-oxo acid dehydrogenase subunit E2 [Acidobacteriota bacterium]